MGTPRRNRVTPSGDIVAASARGTLMGNRGCLHDDHGRIVRSYTEKRWIVCELEYKGKRVPLAAPGHYTPLFFLDEATAFAAGHRPCAFCMRERYNAFRLAWAAGNPALTSSTLPSATELDEVLHRERLDSKRAKTMYSAPLVDLPDGTMVRLPASGPAYLVRGDALLAWSLDGYGAPRWISGHTRVDVLTPRSLVYTLQGGYRVRVHPSAASRAR